MLYVNIKAIHVSAYGFTQEVKRKSDRIVWQIPYKKIIELDLLERIVDDKAS